MSKYDRGADFERDVVKHFQKRKHIAFRCAGSKGNATVPGTKRRAKVDVIVIDKNEDGLPLLIQCKLSGEITHKDKEALIDVAKAFSCIPVLASKDQNGKIELNYLLYKGEKMLKYDMEKERGEIEKRIKALESELRFQNPCTTKNYYHQLRELEKLMMRKVKLDDALAVMEEFGHSQ